MTISTGHITLFNNGLCPTPQNTGRLQKAQKLLKFLIHYMYWYVNIGQVNYQKWTKNFHLSNGFIKLNPSIVILSLSIIRGYNHYKKRLGELHVLRTISGVFRSILLGVLNKNRLCTLKPYNFNNAQNHCKPVTQLDIQ